MDRINEWVYPSTRIADAVRFRPASLEIFYALACDPWTEGGKTLREVSAEHGLPFERLSGDLDTLPVPDAGSPWEALPAHFLIDFLTDEHRRFLHSDLPAFRSLLEMPFPEASGGRLFRVLLDAFHRFQGKLSSHIQKEEERIFPAILMNEYSLRTGLPRGDDPASSERLLASSRLLGNEEDLNGELERWSRSLGAEDTLGGPPKAAELAAHVLLRLEGKIRAHTDLERYRLYPMAARMENELAGVTVAGPA